MSEKIKINLNRFAFTQIAQKINLKHRKGHYFTLKIIFYILK